MSETLPEPQIVHGALTWLGPDWMVRRDERGRVIVNDVNGYINDPEQLGLAILAAARHAD